jgi:hypothetical protein
MPMFDLMPDKEKYGHGRQGRRSIRLKDYDYSQQGAYFVTICAKNRECLLETQRKGRPPVAPYSSLDASDWPLYLLRHIMS